MNRLSSNLEHHRARSVTVITARIAGQGLRRKTCFLYICGTTMRVKQDYWLCAGWTDSLITCKPTLRTEEDMETAPT